MVHGGTRWYTVVHAGTRGNTRLVGRTSAASLTALCTPRVPACTRVYPRVPACTTVFPRGPASGPPPSSRGRPPTHMFIAVCVSALLPPRVRSAPSRIVACASDSRPDSPRRAVVLVADAAAPERTATDMVATLRAQGWAVRLGSSGAGADAALAEDPQAVFELQRSASSFALQEACEARQATHPHTLPTHMTAADAI